MNAVKRRLSAATPDAGISLVEVMVALLVFSIAAAGLAAGAMSISRITSDAGSRQVATNLAAEELDKVRAIGNALEVTAVDPRTDTTTDPGRTYTITRTVSSVTASGADTVCGTNATFAYRRVTVTVDWTGRLSTTAPIRSDTILAPNSPVNDAGTGAMSIRVIGADGTPRAGVAVTVTPVSGGKALSSQPAATDVEGCAYATRVVPGTYQVVLSKSGYVDTAQQETPTVSTAVVAAGSTYGWTLQYDLAAVYVTNYAKNYSGTVTLPSDLVTSFVPDNPTYKTTTRTPTAASQKLHPLSGYSAVAGSFVDSLSNITCASADPRNWPAGNVGSKKMLAGERASAPAAASGSTATFGTSTTSSIPMGVVKVTGLPLMTIVAKNVSGSGVGDPGCSTPATYTFPRTGLDGTAVIALPFGTWSLTSVTALGVSLPLTLSQATVLTNEDANGVTSSLLGGTVAVLDPRKEAK